MRGPISSTAFVFTMLAFEATAVGQELPDVTETVTPDSATDEITEQVDVPATDSEADITETLDGAPSDHSSSPNVSASVSPSPPRVTLNGWARESLDWTFNDEGSKDAVPDPFALPRDKLVSRTQLLLRAGYRQGDFEAALSGVVGVRLHEQGTADGSPFLGWNGQRTDVELETDLREAYVGATVGPFDIRIGQQRVAWGHSDVFTPNDVLNARDLRDPFLAEPELRFRPTPLLRATTSFDETSFEVLVSPVFVPDRVDLLGSNWTPLNLDTPASYRGFVNMLRRSLDPSLQHDLTSLLYQTKTPRPFNEATAVSAKLATTLLGIDFSFYYQYGYDGTPHVQMNSSFAYLVDHTDFANARFADLAPVLRALDSGLRPYRSEYVRRHHLGFDATTTAGSFVLRIDTAYESARVFYAADFTSFVSRAFLGVLGIEYQTGSIDKLLELEIVYVRMLDNPSTTILGYGLDTLVGVLVTRWPLIGILSLNLRAVLGLLPRTYVLQPAIRATIDALTVDLGALILDGDQHSLGWISRRNTSAFLQARLAF